MAGHTSITVQVNVTATDAQGVGYLTVYPSGQTHPTAFDLDFVAGQTVPDLVVSALGSQGQLTIYNGSASPVQVIVDVQGFFG